LGGIADVKVGLQTGDNAYYLRKCAGARGSYQLLDGSKLLTEGQLANLTEKEKRNGINPKKYDGRHFVPYHKGGSSDADGGWLPSYYVPTQYFIDWSKDAVQSLQSSPAARFQNSGSYFSEGLTFSRTGVYAPTYRLNSSSVFDTEGSAIISDELEPRA